MGLLTALVILVCIFAPVCGAEGCSGLRHLENGQTFFRYGGLLMIFRCHPGYKLHGYKTNSCVSGHWTREPAVCVGSGCSNPGPLTHGTSSMNEDGSWAVFRCNSGFRLHGPSMLYCKGRIWNSTKPVCKESDMMSSISGAIMQKSYQNLQISAALKSQQHSHYDTLTNTASKEADLKFGLLSHTPSQVNMTHPKAHLQKHIQFPRLKAKDGVQTTRQEAQLQAANEAQGAEEGTKGLGSEAEKVDKVTQSFASESHQFTTVSLTVSSVSGKERSTSSPPSFSAAFTETAVKEQALSVFGFEVPSQEDATHSEGTTTTDIHQQQVETGSQNPFFSHPVDKEKPIETSSTSVYSTSTNSSFAPSPTTSTSSIPSSTQFNVKMQPPNVTLPSNTTNLSSYWTEYNNFTLNTTSKPPLSLSRRPVCPYPPVPAHGTFSFRSVENPGPRDYRHYIQYACYPGYTLAYGDIHSYCQQGGTWSGVTPVCLELTPCSVNNGGCSQLCSHSLHYNQSSNQNQTRTQCLCRPGFTLLDDGRTCRDVDECVEEQHQCQQRCINTFGSFKCSCDDGYHPVHHDQTSCTDVDECLLPAAVTGCVFGCVNTPGSFHCQCPAGYSLQTADGHCQDIDECAVNQGLGPCKEQCHNSPGSYRCSCTYGHILAGDGLSCISGCPPGYRTQPAITPNNSTAQTGKQECVDINECQEEICDGQCINLPGSHRCICPRGFTLQRDGRRCRDINECNRKNGGCSHVCVNQRGGYKCACPPSHRLSAYSWKKCVPRTTANTAG